MPDPTDRPGPLLVTLRVEATFPEWELGRFLELLLAWKTRCTPPLYLCELQQPHGCDPVLARLHIELAVDALAGFLGLLRTWDGGQDDRHVDIHVSARTLPIAQLNAILATLDPPLPFRIDIFRIDIPRPSGEG